MHRILAINPGSTSTKFAVYFDIECVLNKTIRHSFDDRAIVNGGLIPTNPQCLVDAPEANISSGNTNENTLRWRGGSLVTQLIDADRFMNDTSKLVKQNPTDLYRKRVINGVDIDLKVDLNADGDYIDAGEEIYGGLRARYRVDTVADDDKYDGNPANATFINDAFLYEIVLYWHYDGGTCYGNASWSADIIGASNSASNLSTKNYIAALELDLEEAELIRLAKIAAGEDTTRIDEIIQALKDKIADGLIADDASSIINTGTPTPPADSTPRISPSLGPNFKTGKRTWIDL